jgi:hypothetical protein
VPPEQPDTRRAGSWRAAGTWQAASPPRPGSGSWRKPRSTVPRLIVPAYFHPSLAAEDWARMARQAAQIRAIVLNPASGPGEQPDPAYITALQPLKEAGVTIAGYVDTNYGQRPWRAALADIEQYQDWYGIDGVLYDRVSAGPAELRHYALLARRARKLGAETVVFNHGVHPHDGYARHADVLGTFEGPWSVYLEQAVPQWTRSWPPDRFYHVVYSVPPEHLASAFMVAGRRRAGSVYVTDHGGGNPYNRLPALVPAPTAAQWARQRRTGQ